MSSFQCLRTIEWTVHSPPCSTDMASVVFNVSASDNTINIYTGLSTPAARSVWIAPGTTNTDSTGVYMFELIHGETLLVTVAEGKNVFTSTGVWHKMNSNNNERSKVNFPKTKIYSLKPCFIISIPFIFSKYMVPYLHK